MQIRIPRGWEIPEALATPEHLVFGRRKAAALGVGLLAAPAAAWAQQADALPAMRNTRYPPGRDITAEREVTTFNNFYEFGSHKGISRAAQALPQRPWTVKVEGMVETPREFGIEDLLRTMPLEERVYRLRCVEAWSMVVPWTGFPLSALLAAVKPLGSARYVVFETAAIPTVMPGLRQSWYPWPYTEGCTIAEAANELSFMVVGAYGKLLPPQNGGPIRFHQPWKYGFKAGKSIVRIALTDQRPVSFWERIQPQEYGFWANVNPEVPHPRWSQASERVLGGNARVPTQLFNGYGEFVSGLYTGLSNERLWA
ncbi:protein-methionine-sulfoxide reductase catalytic subunit MsrP [Roseomonas sp. HF4]|uniref:protein-methionine-sulfoxide reductase catalytic subunit MsrP n=1 Tax=Roseomonas sp. HF4 TaxID=2562313 RepID=UPI0010C02BAB|nr:protein-methionine-sulfoxide reductase catalytic subunit MsrP [Roseomonas sp. HF4]